MGIRSRNVYPTGFHIEIRARNKYPTGFHIGIRSRNEYPTGFHVGIRSRKKYPTGFHMGIGSRNKYPTGFHMEIRSRNEYPTAFHIGIRSLHIDPSALHIDPTGPNGNPTDGCRHRASRLAHRSGFPVLCAPSQIITSVTTSLQLPSPAFVTARNRKEYSVPGVRFSMVVLAVSVAGTVVQVLPSVLYCHS